MTFSATPANAAKRSQLNDALPVGLRRQSQDGEEWYRLEEDARRHLTTQGRAARREYSHWRPPSLPQGAEFAHRGPAVWRYRPSDIQLVAVAAVAAVAARLVALPRLA